MTEIIEIGMLGYVIVINKLLLQVLIGAAIAAAITIPTIKFIKKRGN